MKNTLLFLFYGAAITAAMASGSRVGLKDAFATARGNAFVATANNVSAVYYNPAGLVDLEGHRLGAGVYHVSLSSNYSGAGGQAAMEDDYHTVPQVYYSSTNTDKSWAWGLGVYAPYGLATEWADSSPLRTFALRNEQSLTTYSVVGAHRLSPTLSIGLALNYQRAETDLRRRIGVFGPTDLFRFEGSGDTFGGGVSLLWRPDPKHSFGLNYSHSASIEMDGTTDTVPLISAEPSTARFVFPEIVVVGYSYRPNSKWNLEVNLDWTNWDRLNTVVIQKGSGAVPLPFNWKSGLFYEFGATRYLANGWRVSGGYFFTENSVPDATYTPAVPDSNRHFYSLGLGYETERISVDFAWHYADGGRRKVVGSAPSLIGASADGTYSNSLNAFALSVEWKW